MKITLLVDGREMAISKEQEIAIRNIVGIATSTEKRKVQVPKEVANVPREGKWFEVDPQTIDQKLFQEKEEQISKKTRKPHLSICVTCHLILEAFEELKNNPGKYGRKFKTLIPKKEWQGTKPFEELKEYACTLGDHNADWVEQALEWAQRICNGESWKTICVDPDTAKWHRLVVYKDDVVWIVGGSRKFNDNNPVSFYERDSIFGDDVEGTVPLVVDYID